TVIPLESGLRYTSTLRNENVRGIHCRRGFWTVIIGWASGSCNGYRQGRKKFDPIHNLFSFNQEISSKTSVVCQQPYASAFCRISRCESVSPRRVAPRLSLGKGGRLSD